MEDNLGLVKLLLNLEDAVGLLGILVLGEVLAQLGHNDGVGVGCGRPCGARVLDQELVNDLAEELMGYEGRVLLVGDNDAADAFAATVGMECVVCFERGRVELALASEM